MSELRFTGFSEGVLSRLLLTLDDSLERLLKPQEMHLRQLEAARGVRRMNNPVCTDCGAALTVLSEPSGVIFYRFFVKNRWESLPICTACYAKHEPERPPYRILWGAFV